MYNEEFKEKLKKAISYNYKEVPLDDNIEDYHINDDDALDGHRLKKFKRIKSDLFDDLIHELQSNPNCSYVTYANKIIKEGYIPKKLSCLIKMLPQDIDQVFNETLASQILNLYECPTSYNLVVQDTNSTGYSSYKLLSVDMVSEDMISLEDAYCQVFNHLNNAIEVMINELKQIKSYDLFDTDNFEVPIDEILKNFVYSFLIRKFVLQDSDFSESNSGLLLANNRLEYVNFDYEYILSEPYIFPNITKSLTLVKSNFPEIYEKFASISHQMYKDITELIQNKEINYFNDDHFNNVNKLHMNLRMCSLACKNLEKISAK